MRQFILTQKAFMKLAEIGETYDYIRSQFPSMDLEQYLNSKIHRHDPEYDNHAMLLFWIYFSEEHETVLRNIEKRSTMDNDIMATIYLDRIEEIEPRLLKEGRIESLIEQEILQEVKIVMLSQKELEDLHYILDFVKRGYYEEDRNYGFLNNFLNLELSQGQLDHMIAKFKQQN